jgi:hypothetical protein
MTGALMGEPTGHRVGSPALCWLGSD